MKLPPFMHVTRLERVHSLKVFLGRLRQQNVAEKIVIMTRKFPASNEVNHENLTFLAQAFKTKTVTNITVKRHRFTVVPLPSFTSGGGDGAAEAPV